MYEWVQNGCMGIMQIRDLPDDVHAEFTRRARLAHQSLQQYMRAFLIEHAQRPSTAQIWTDAAIRARENQASYPLDEAVADVRAMRDRDRDQ